MLRGYQAMSTSELFIVQRVKLKMPLLEMISRPTRKAICEICEEEIMNGREVVNHGVVLCIACTGESYYHCSADSPTAELIDRTMES
jgi:formylmethanofuran dehydrogenase subunit E